MMKRLLFGVTILAALSLIVAAGCSTKETVKTGTQYKCKNCGKIYRDDTKELTVSKDIAKTMEIKVVEGYCPKCGDEIITVNQLQHKKCPICGKDMGTETKAVKIERKLADTLPKEANVAVACSAPKCAAAGRLHDKYNWEWAVCKAIVEQSIDYGFSEEQVREAWGPPKRVETVGNAKRWYYDAGYVTIGASGKVVEIKQ